MPEKPIFTGGYAPMQDYIAPLHPQLWRLFVGIGLMLGVYLIGVVAYLSVFVFVLGINTQDIVTGRTPAAMLILLYSFGFLGLAAMLAALWPGRRPVFGLIGPIGPARRDFLRSLLAMVPIIAITAGISWAFDPSLAAHIPLAQVAPWLVFGIIALLIQVSAEELVFRGYIMGQLAARFSHPFAWMILPSALFGAVHYEPQTYGTAAWIVCLSIMFYAIVISDITARTGNLGAAIAIHFGNNFMAMFVIGEVGKLDGLAQYTIVVDPADPITMATQFLYILILWLTIRWALRV
jgi:membrane protease YdiL (CAAX protease family)